MSYREVRQNEVVFFKELIFKYFENLDRWINCCTIKLFNETESVKKV